MAKKMTQKIKPAFVPISSHELEMQRRAANLAKSKDQSEVSRKKHEDELKRREANRRKAGGY